RLRGGSRRRRDPHRDRVRPARRRPVRRAVGREPRPAADHRRDALRSVLHRVLQRHRRPRLRSPRPAYPPDIAPMAETLLDVEDLHVHFATEDGVVRAVDGVSFKLERGKVLGIVGESGSGKSVTSMTSLGLTRGVNAKFEGAVRYKDQDLLTMSEAQLRRFRGNEVAMIFQDPMTAMTPVYRVGDQIIEGIQTHEDVSKKTARNRAVQL